MIRKSIIPDSFPHSPPGQLKPLQEGEERQRFQKLDGGKEAGIQKETALLRALLFFRGKSANQGINIYVSHKQARGDTQRIRLPPPQERFLVLFFYVFTRLPNWSAVTSQLFSVKDLLKQKIHEASTLWSDINLRRIKCCVFFCTTGVS